MKVVVCDVQAAATFFPAQTPGAGTGEPSEVQQLPSAGMPPPALAAKQLGARSGPPLLSSKQTVACCGHTCSLQQGANPDTEDFGATLAVQIPTHEQSWPPQARAPTDPYMVYVGQFKEQTVVLHSSCLVDRHSWGFPLQVCFS